MKGLTKTKGIILSLSKFVESEVLAWVYIKEPFQYRWRIAVQSEPNALKGKED